MKALDILRQIKLNDNYCNDCKGLDYCNNNNYQKICGMLFEIDEAISELESLEYKDRLAELEKVILDYYLDKGYQIGVNDWYFKINIDTYHKWKMLFVMFRDKNKNDNPILVYQQISETTKEMFDKAIEHFKI